MILELPLTYDDSLTFFGIYETNLASIQNRKEAKERSNQDKKASQPASICGKGREEGCFEKKVAKAGKPEEKIQRRKGKF